MDTNETPSPAPADEEVHVEPIPAPVIAYPAPEKDATPIAEAPAAPVAAAAVETAPVFNAEIAQLKLQANPDIMRRLRIANISLVCVRASGHVMIVDGFQENDTAPSFAASDDVFWFKIVNHQVEPTSVPTTGQQQVFNAQATCLF